MGGCNSAVFNKNTLTLKNENIAVNQKSRI